MGTFSDDPGYPLMILCRACDVCIGVSPPLAFKLPEPGGM